MSLALRRLLLLAGALFAAPVLAQDEEWAKPPTLSPPPPPPPVVEPLPSAPPPPPAPVPVAPPLVVEEAVPSAPTRFRFAPTLRLLGVSLARGPTRWTSIGAPSIRTGLRIALKERSTANYSMNYSIALEVGLEGLRTAVGRPFYGFGFTARAGLAPVTRGGLFFPFFDGYGLATLSVVTINGVTAVTPRVGMGVNFNAFAMQPGGGGGDFRVGNLGGSGGAAGFLLVLLVLVMPNVELVWTPPNVFNPGVHSVEIRLGIGF